VFGGDDSVENLQKLRDAGARDNYRIAAAMRLLANAEKAPTRILAKIHREVLALNLELATGNDVFHVRVSSSGAKREARPAKRAAPYATAYGDGKGDF
jgi:hypothetical protein